MPKKFQKSPNFQLKVKSLEINRTLKRSVN